MNSAAIIARPATRRMRRFGDDVPSESSSLVYVGPNPVPKKTTRMLRKANSSNSQQQQRRDKRIARKASQTKLKPSLKTATNVNSAVTATAPKAPRRKLSNPSLCAETQQFSPKFPSRKPSFPEFEDTDSEHDDEPFSNLYCRSPVVTRSRSKLALAEAEAPKVPCRKLSLPGMDIDSDEDVDRVPSNTSPHHDEKAPHQRLDCCSPTTLQATLALEATLAASRFDSQQPCLVYKDDPWRNDRLAASQMAAPKVPQRRASMTQTSSSAAAGMVEDQSTCISSPKRHSLQGHQQKLSFMDLEWSQMSFQ